MAARILIGTSGYSYDDWVGPFYPPGTRKEDFLSYYATHFPVVELNFSYYAQPAPRTTEKMVRSTPDGFQFALKAHQSMTHKITDNLRNDVATFREGVKPLQDGGRLSAVLLQFPYSFGYTPESRKRLAQICDALSGLPLAVEFRKSDWLRPKVFEGLRQRGISLVSVDEPDLPKLLKPTTEVTGRFGYIRFHGRNKENWWTGDNASRYDYLYSDNELGEWTPRIQATAALAPELLIFFNNHANANATRNATALKVILDAQGLM